MDKEKPNIVYRKDRLAIEKRIVPWHGNTIYAILEIVTPSGLYIEWPEHYTVLENAIKAIGGECNEKSN